MTTSGKSNLRSVLLGGVIPLAAYTFVEMYFGTLWGLVAGMALGAAEIVHEWYRQGKVDAITWIANGILFVMGGISLLTNEGVWFKLQPALLEALTGIFLIGSVLVHRPFLNLMAEKQGMLNQFPANARPLLLFCFRGITFRLGGFFLLHALLATWAALYWSTAAWVVLKGVGFTGSLVLYFAIEMIVMRHRLKRPA